MMTIHQVGAVQDDTLLNFSVWAPLHDRMQLHVVHPAEALYPMMKDERGYWHVAIKRDSDNPRYFFRPGNSRDFPDPASNYQPEGVHGASEAVDHNSFRWTDDAWQPPELSSLVFYELHVGTFTPEGTFEAIIHRLPHLLELGINAIELMPVNQFPGDRNWGYDGVYPFAVQNSYGGPNGLKKLIDACHQHGICVFIDVVYNHLGPEGNYLQEFAPYFTTQYRTPWGDALNFDGEWSDGVRDYFVSNALYWFTQYHADGLRCDAIHMVYDNGAIPFFEYLHQQVKQLEQQTGRSYYLVAESDLNSPKVILEPANGGYGFDAQWLDDFHHSLYTLLDVKGKQRYEDYGALEQLAKAYTDGFVLSGEWVKFRKRKYGRSSAGVAGNHFVVFNQNHDQVGNRVHGERLCMLVDAARQKLAAAAVILAPYLPMLFMGEEYADDSPFFYFVSHSDPELIDAVRKGRKEEFKAFENGSEPPDAIDENTFLQSKLKWETRNHAHHREMFEWHKKLIHLRKKYAVFTDFLKQHVRTDIIEDKVLLLHRDNETEHAVCIFNFSEKEVSIDLPDAGDYQVILHSAENARFDSVAPLATVILHRYKK